MNCWVDWTKRLRENKRFPPMWPMSCEHLLGFRAPSRSSSPSRAMRPITDVRSKSACRFASRPTPSSRTFWPWPESTPAKWICAVSTTCCARNGGRGPNEPTLDASPSRGTCTPTARSPARDRASLWLIVHNLFDNAVEYADGGSRITIACRPEGSKSRATVANLHRRLSPQDVDRRFDRFFCGAHPPQRQSQFHGSRPSLCRSLAELLGGGLTATIEGEFSARLELWR